MSMPTIFASSVIRGDTIKLPGINGGCNAVVEQVNKSGSTVKIVVRNADTGEKMTLNVPHSSKLEQTVKVVR